MTTTRPSSGVVPTWRQLSGPASFLLIVSAAAWVGVVTASRGMSDMPGTMGLSFVAFAAVWALMMTAMMLPTIAPFAALYTRTLTGHRTRRMTALAAGYLLVWTAAAVPAYAIAWLAETLVSTRPTAATAVGVVIFTAAGVYELTPIKARCLARCRSPLGFLFSYGNYRGRLRDMRVGISHGAFCLACCWALMGVLVAVGLMNLLAMVVLAAVVLVEKTSTWGPRLSRAIGVIALVLAVAVIIRPSLATGLQPMPSSPGMTDQQMSS